MWLIEKLKAGDSNVPFRESKHPNSLGGNSKTLLHSFAVALPRKDVQSSLPFAEKVSKVDLKVKAVASLGVENL
jgi:hypothetical protein